MTLIKWNPTYRPPLFNEIDRWFNNISSDFPSFFEGQSLWKPRFEVLDTKGVIECLIHINKNKPLLTKRYINTNMNQLTFNDYEGED